MAVRFNGTTDQLTYSGTLPTTTGGISLVCWVYLSVDRNDWSCFTRMSDGGTSIVYLATDASGTDMGWFSAAGSITGFSFAVGNWHRVAATLTGTAATLYTATATGAVTVGTATLLTGAPTELGIGGRGSGDSTEPFNGRVAGWKLWNGVLTRAEIEAEWRQQLPIRSAGLHAGYPIPNATPDGRLDYSGNGRMLAAGATAVGTEDGPPVPMQLVRPRLILATPSGGTTFTQSLGGAVTPSATVVKQDRKPLAGSTAPTGAATRQLQRTIAGTVAPTGAAAKLLGRILGGAVIPSGLLVRQPDKFVGGATVPGGSLIRSIGRRLVGSVTPTGTLAAVRTRLIALVGATTPAGALTRGAGKALAGTVGPASTVTKRITRTVGGSLVPSAALLKLLARVLGGGTAPSGTVGTVSLVDLVTDGTASQGSRQAVSVRDATRGSASAAAATRTTYTATGG